MEKEQNKINNQNYIFLLKTVIKFPVVLKHHIQHNFFGNDELLQAFHCATSYKTCIINILVSSLGLK